MPKRSGCWECTRRKSPCDGTIPICKQCQQSKIVCPGYGDWRPLTWLPMGAVTRLSKAKRLGKAAPSTHLRTGKRSDNLLKASATARLTVIGIDSDENDDPESSIYPLARIADAGENERQKEIMSVARRKWQDNIYAARSRDLRPQEWDCIDLVNCWNSMVSSKFRSRQLASSSHYDDRLDISAVQALSPAYRHCLIAVAFSFRIGLLSMMHGLDTAVDPSSLASPLTANAYRHIGLALHEVNNDLRKLPPAAHPNDVSDILASIYSLIVSELMLSKSPQWRGHTAGFLALMKHYGGLGYVLSASDGRIFHLQTFVIQMTLYNTTCPSHAQIEEVTNFDIADLERVFNLSIYPQFYGPAILFLSVARINRLRLQLRDTSLDLEFSLCDILDDIEQCDIEDWIRSKELPKTKELLLVARVIKAAVTLYATLAVPHTFIVCTGGCYQRSAGVVRNDFFKILEEAIESGIAPHSIAWPIIVGGAAVVTAEQRVLVEKCLSLAVQDPFTGIGPWITRDAMERFWDSGKANWDDFLEPPYGMLIV
ncbi:Phomenoic acid biosynthesis cluster-specific transcriptional regulator-like protein [Cladobotryum mycophilum]|uniref:Phomenoic acid biosynthesis cluster-specific transcriptional regulator-like protein n=1 Tax=Cladobotryum mycophilum TaxID=491253 RepID=A0ABR0SHZ0_9HYPO